ncbi:MAG: hypothetical protein LUO93_10310, partial [Methanomicrobiales archaeon]|nr:hypothetical protein [Methanomicrobiales archaeon]
MSVEEAKKVAASFAGTSFVPPPRTIHDIVVMLDQQPPADAVALKTTLARLKQTPPNTTDLRDLSAFYLTRGVWAYHLGRVRQAIEDLRRAVDYARQGRSGREHVVLQALAHAESQGGSFSSSVTHLRQAISRVTQESRGYLIIFHAFLAASEAAAGDLTAADASLGEMRKVLAESAGWQALSPAQSAVLWRFAASGEAAVAGARGQLAKAEGFYRDAVANASRAVDLGFRQHDDPALPDYTEVVNRLRVPLINVLIREGRLLEAENEARASLRETVRTQGRYSMNTALQLEPLVRVVAEQGRYAEAETLARVLGDILDKVGALSESVVRARAWDMLGEVLAAQGRWAEALAAYDQLRDGMKEDAETYEKLFAGSVTRALALVQGGRAQEAVAALDRQLARVGLALGDNDPSVAEVHGALGVAHAALGNQPRGLDKFGRASVVLLASRPEEAAGATWALAQQRRRLIL